MVNAMVALFQQTMESSENWFSETADFCMGHPSWYETLRISKYRAVIQQAKGY